MTELYFSGFNGFKQFGTEAHTLKANKFIECRFNDEIKNIIKNGLCSFSWSFNVFAFNNELIVVGFIEQKSNNYKKFKTDDKIIKISSNDNICLILLENGDLFNLNIHQCTLFKLNFINIECSQKRTIFGEVKDEKITDAVEYIACGNLIKVAITKNNVVYSIPSKIYQFDKHEKIKTLVCGFEHALVLTKNGDIYTWGYGLRGQFGTEFDVNIQETPILVESLAGIKIILISAGSWHNAAISAFGDIYVWGSNVDGQLGIRVYNVTNVSSESNRIKNPTLYSYPQLIDLPNCCTNSNLSANDEQEIMNECNIVRVACGGRHTFIQKSCGKVFCCGWNKHGQLGVSSDHNFIDTFVECKILPKIPTNIICGPWSTVIM